MNDHERTNKLQFWLIVKGEVEMSLVDIDRFCLNKHIEGCYCACHDPLSSCPACEHCCSDSEAARDYRRRYRELLLDIGDRAAGFRGLSNDGVTPLTGGTWKTG